MIVPRLQPLLLFGVFALLLSTFEVIGQEAFDLYIMCMSYQPEFCYNHQYDEYYYCENPKNTWRYNLTLHGLWPEYSDGGYPSSCTTEEFDESVVDEIGVAKFEILWVNVKEEVGEGNYTDFWEHEWSKHGTCSGLDQLTYFNETLIRHLKTPESVYENYGGSVNKQEFVDFYGGSTMVAVVCDAGKYLSEVRVCLGVDEDAVPTEQIECPQHVLDEDSCTEQEIYIDEFYVDRCTARDNFGCKDETRSNLRGDRLAIS